jgi:hypothetical protein
MYSNLKKYYIHISHVWPNSVITFCCKLSMSKFVSALLGTSNTLVEPDASIFWNLKVESASYLNHIPED